VARPNAMDEVNADAFQEAYKDLVNLPTSLWAAASLSDESLLETLSA
jgi:hypothetical protein